MESGIKNIVFYDGECGLCNRSVQFILKHEKDDLLHFASLQSDFAKNFFINLKHPQPDPETFVFIKNNQVLLRSDAAIELCKHLRAPYSWARIFKWVPRMFRDAVYNLIARNRHRLSVKKCEILDQDQRNRFLDQ
jgi:predicted DCC family thiol-disulfide oxidoreductase YuxK